MLEISAVLGIQITQVESAWEHAGIVNEEQDEQVQREIVEWVEGMVLVIEALPELASDLFRDGLDPRDARRKDQFLAG